MKQLLFTLAAWLALSSAWAGADSTNLTRIAFLSDTHVNSRTNDTGVLYRRHGDEAIAAVNAAKVDLVLIAGDLTDGGTKEQYEIFKQRLHQFQAPVLFVAGNHDVGDAGKGEKGHVTSQRMESFVKNLSPAWYVREAAGLRVIGVTSSLFGSGLPQEQEQWQFLEKELAHPAAQPTLVLEHYPLFLHKPDEGPEGYWNILPEPRQHMLSLLKQGQVKALLSGHLHRPITNHWEGILFLGNGSVAWGIPAGKQPAGWTLVSVPQQGDIQFEFRPLD